MMFTLFVGDISSETCNAAVEYDHSAQLFTGADLSALSATTYYTSLGDCDNIDTLIRLCRLAREIYYIKPQKWNDTDKNNFSEQQQNTEHVLYYFSQIKPVYNLPKIITETWLHDIRKHQTQFWAVGCSITKGVGVDNEQSWPALISKELNLPYTNLSCTSSSIIWQSDQICRSDIRANDIVFWGVTSQHRIPYIDSQGNLIHLAQHNFSKYHASNNISLELLDGENLVYQNILAVRRAYNYCQKIGAFLVPLGLMYDNEFVYRKYDVPVFYQLMDPGINQYIDFGTDSIHPGPEQHKIFANEFLSHYKRTYCQS